MVCVVAVTTASVPASYAATGSTAPIELSVIPGKSELSATVDTEVTVLATNTGDEQISHLHVEPVYTHGETAEVTVTPDGLVGLPPHGSKSFGVVLPAWSLATPPPNLALLASFRVNGGPIEMMSAGAELLPPAALEPDKLATLEAKASLATLKSGQTEPVYLTVHNKAALPLVIETVIGSGPSFIDFEGEPEDLTVDKGRTVVIKLDAVADDRVRPGEQQLVFRVPVKVGGAHFDLVATQTAKVGVAGESEVLTALGIPSLLLLPGFLVLATASIFWRARFLRDESDDGAFPFPLKEPESWVLTVIGSAVILFVAWLLGIDLLDQYGLTELIVLWLVSMALGFAIYVVAQLISNYRRRSRIPRDSDGPIAILEKLAKQRLDLQRPHFSYDTGSGTVELYLLQPENEKRPSTWSAPKIVYTWTDLDEDLNARIQDQLDRSHDAAALAASLRKGVEKGALSVSFAGNNAVRSAVMVTTEKVKGLASPMVMAGEQ